MTVIALPTTNFAENAVMTASRVSAVSWCIAQNIYQKGERRIMMKMENEMNVNVPLEVVKASEIEPNEVKWLWYPYIPFGKVTLLQGDPGDGKSKLMLSIAALLSKGEALPFTDEETEPMTIIYQTTEDDADDTVVPRFNSASGDGENLISICSIICQKDYEYKKYIQEWKAGKVSGLRGVYQISMHIKTNLLKKYNILQ